MDVPYSADYNQTKFDVTVTKKTPIVIVLSQLDGRYFKGMEGDYTFQLHFRLDKEGEDDYIVRSHGNYAMKRSVSTDLPELEPGTYSVLMKITAHRFWPEGTPEQAIRKVANDRPNKLIQIGLAYDLAHAKGEIIETEEEKEARSKLEEKKKASLKTKQRKEISEAKKKKWEFGKREKARETRHEKRRQEYQRKKAAKQDAARPSSVGEQSAKSGEGATDVTGTEAEVEKQAVAGAEQDKTGDKTVNAAGMPSPPAEAPNVNGNQNETTRTANAGEAKATDGEPKSETAKAEQFANDLKNIPSVTVNDGPPPQQAPGSALAPPSVASSVAGMPDDDYLYDSDASFQSSVDSVLDFPSDDIPAAEDSAAAAAADDEDDSDVEFSSDPWNAVCVVGLRVYSKDEGCSIKAVRPRPEEESKLEVDDVSKGVSGEKPEKPLADDVKTEVKTGVE